MREIKFRAWDSNMKRMVLPEDIRYSFEINLYGSFSVSSMRDSDNGRGPFWCEDSSAFTLMMFTGLRDKNGKEIYEGDIIKYLLGGLSGLFDVRFDHNGFWIKSGYDDSNFFPNSEFVEVVGNIYENPELLGKQ